MIDSLGTDVDRVRGVVQEMAKIDWLGDDCGVWSESEESATDGEDSEGSSSGNDEEEDEEEEEEEEQSGGEESVSRKLIEKGNAVGTMVNACQYEKAVEMILSFYDEMERKEYRERKNRKVVKDVWREVTRGKEMLKERLIRLLDFKASRAEALLEAGRRNHREVLVVEDDSVELGLMAKMGWGMEATVLFCSRRTLGITELLQNHPHTDDPLTYVSIVAQSFFTKLSEGLREFFDIFGGGEGEAERGAKQRARSVNISVESRIRWYFCLRRTP